MRTINADLTSAVTARTQRPAISVIITDYAPHYALYQNTGVAEGQSDALVNSDGSILRGYVTDSAGANSASLYWQKITDPDNSVQWSTWSALSLSNMSRDGGCACVKFNDGNWYIFAQAGNSPTYTMQYWKAPDGVTWSGPFSLPALPVAGTICRGIAADGNSSVWAIYDDGSGHESVAFISEGGGTWAGAWTQVLTGLTGSGGLACVFNSSTTYVAISNGIQILAYTYSAGVLTSLQIISPADTSTGVIRILPKLSIYDGLYNLCYIEQDSGIVTGLTYSYPRYRQSPDFQHWSDGLLMNGSCSFAVVPLKAPAPPAGSAGARYYLAGSTLIFSAGVARASQDVSTYVLAYKRVEKVNGPGEIDLRLSNKDGQINTLVGNVLGLNSAITVQEGYWTGSPPAVNMISTATYHITSYHFLRTPSANELHLKGQDALFWMDRECRNSYTYNSQSVSYLANEISCRAGILHSSQPGTAQMANTYSVLIMTAGTRYKATFDEVMSTYGLAYYLDQNEILVIRELSGSDTSVWMYQVEWEELAVTSDARRGNHVLVSGKPPTASQLTIGEAYDWGHMQQVGYEHIVHTTDYKLDSAAKASLKAGFMLLDEQRSGISYSITIPPNPALQVCDVVTLIDSQIGQNGNARIMQITTEFASEQGAFSQVLEMEGV